jgi:hypothetical protein
MPRSVKPFVAALIDIQRPQAVLPTDVEIVQQLLYVSLFSRPTHHASTCVVL